MNFDTAIEYVLANEGGYVDRVLDLGGPTNFGITLALLSKFEVKNCTVADIKNLNLEYAKKIYYEVFWEHMGLDKFELGVATALLDTAVNEGQGGAVKCAQTALRLSVDGILGPQTTLELQVCDKFVFLSNFISAIQNYYVDKVVARPDQIAFLKGWLSRSRRLYSL